MKHKIRFGYWKEGKRKAFTMSYDDGQLHDRKLVEIMNRYGLKGTFHLNSAKFDTPKFVTSAEIAALYRGHEISVHTATHPYLDRIPKTELVAEVIEDRKTLESLCGYPVRGMSYPYGAYSAAVIETLKELGMHYSRTTQSTQKFTVPEDFLRWHPTCHHKHDILNKVEPFQKEKNFALFYLWGHSYEFDRDHTWEMIEEFCKQISGDGNVWYATNIEIYDYVMALRSLDLSYDGSTVYNPSAVTVWLEVDGAPVMCKGGEVTRLCEEEE